MREIRKVLLVDDEQDIRTVAKMSLSVVGGWVVAIAASGREALEVAAQEQPDVILLDAMMPEMDGPSTLRALRAQPSTARIPVVFLTAKVQTGEVEQFRGLGAAGVIAKPFDPMDLPNHIRRMVAEEGPVTGPGSMVSVPPAGVASSLMAPASSVLLVEDDVELRALLVPRLRERGYAVVCVSSIADARTELAGRAFTIVVAEASLPDGDGLALLDEVAAREPGTALLLMSAFLADLRSTPTADGDPLLASMISKPFAPEQFVAEVRLAIDAWAVRAKGVRPSYDASPELEASLEALRKEYEGKLRERLEELRGALALARESGDYDTALRLAHRLHGTAGTYGFVEVSRAAATIEHTLRDAVKMAASIDRTRWSEMAAAVDRAARWLSVAPSGPANPWERTGAALPIVLVVDSNLHVCREIEAIGRTALFKTRSAASADEAVQKAQESPAPDGAIIRIGPGDDNAGFGVAVRLRALDGFEALPIAFVAADDSLATRVAAAHAGASIFLRDPGDVDAVTRTVQALVEARHRGGPRVLVVDEDDAFSSFVARLLAGAGIEARCLADPMKIMPTLEAERPDVLLLDVGLPHVSGLDVCRMLRGQIAWRDLPILFLSANATADVRIACFQAGGDDYVAKPILREELLARVRNRYERARLALESSERDSLTGLLLRRAFGDAFARLLAHTRRGDRWLSLVLIDIDHFKSVNDRHGHLVGDTVIAGLGQTLRRSLRAEDVRGRWGGEEFLVALDGLDAMTAGAVMVRMLDDYRQRQFVSESQVSFSATFSAGVASFPDDGDGLEALLAVADRRLYAAKKAGRARVIHTG